MTTSTAARTVTRAPLRYAALLAAIFHNPAPLLADQSNLQPVVNSGDHTLQFDWPAIQIGTGEYEEGPTGVTVFHFAHPTLAAVDVRGGSTGTVNTDYLRLGYEKPELNAVVFAGGSWYGLEPVTAVATALKDDGVAGGAWDNIAFSVGAIIYDFGDRRLNDIYPDKRLAQAALRAARPGVFPLGAHGAGRFARSGSLFGCNAYSGQGAAFRQIGEVKIATFVVVNALGLVTTRDGRVAACYADPGWPRDLRTADLLAAFPRSAHGEWQPLKDETNRNTTLSLVVTNRKLRWDALQRLATEVHTSMGRALQPFSTASDGDVLYAVSTNEIDAPIDAGDPQAIELSVLAAETMWDAILASVPDQPIAPKPDPHSLPSPTQMTRYAGEYVFSPTARLRVTAQQGQLRALSVGQVDVYAIGRESPVALQPVSASDFVPAAGRYPLVLRFDGQGNLTINPGHWQQLGRRVAP